MGSNHSNNAHGSSGSVEHHITPLSVYLKVAGGLFALTFLTIIAHVFKNNYLALAPIIAFAIAAVKAYLVMAWFMHLKYEVPSNRIIFSLGFIFLALLFGICFLDIATRVFQGSVL